MQFMNQNLEKLVSGKPQLNRRINASIVLNMLRREGPLSRADLAKRTGIRSTSISAIIEELSEKNLVHEIGRGKSTGGRHPILLEINPNGLYAAGIEIGEDALNGVVINLSGKTIVAESIALDDTQVETVTVRGNELIDALAGAAGISREQLASVGVAVPGIISKKEGVVVLSRPLDWRVVPLKAHLEEHWRCRVIMLNNAMAGAMAEYFGGAGKGVNSLLYVMVMLRHVRQHKITSVGCGIVLDGRSYFGEGQIAGEIRVDIDHPLASAEQSIGTAYGHVTDLITESKKDPERFRPVWFRFAKQLGMVVSRGIDFLSPGRVVIGSDTPELEELIGDHMLDITNAKTVAGIVAEMPYIRTTPRDWIFFAPLDTFALARGAIIPQLQELSLTPILGDSVFH